MPQIRIFDYPAVIDFSQKIGSYGYVAKSQWGTPRVHLAASGDPLGKKTGQNRIKIPCPKIRILHYPAVIGFSQKMEVTVMAPNHGGDPLRSILGPMGSHWVQKMGQNRKKLPCPKIRGHRFFAKIGSYGYGAKSRWGPPRVQIWGKWGASGSKKWVKTVKNYHAPKFEFSSTPRPSIFPKKWKLRLWRQITVGPP